MVDPVVFTEIGDAQLETAAPEQIAISEKSLKAIALSILHLVGFARRSAAEAYGELKAFLGSHRAKFITGQYINAAGGALLSRA